MDSPICKAAAGCRLLTAMQPGLQCTAPCCSNCRVVSLVETLVLQTTHGQHTYCTILQQGQLQWQQPHAESLMETTYIVTPTSGGQQQQHHEYYSNQPQQHQHSPVSILLHPGEHQGDQQQTHLGLGQDTGAGDKPGRDQDRSQPDTGEHRQQVSPGFFFISTFNEFQSVIWNRSGLKYFITRSLALKSFHNTKINCFSISKFASRKNGLLHLFHDIWNLFIFNV